MSLCLFYVATNVYYLYVARFLSGVVGGGAFFLVPVYVSEIADDKLVFNFLSLSQHPSLGINSSFFFSFI